VLWKRPKVSPSGKASLQAKPNKLQAVSGPERSDA
jgi:hypothetical protein